MPQETRKFPATVGKNTGSGARVVSHHPDVELCYDFVSRIASALHGEEGAALSHRLVLARKTSDLAQLAVSVGQDTALVERALSIGDEELERLTGVTGDKIRDELRNVLALVVEQSPEEEVNAKKRKYITALAVSMGANETTARLSAEALVQNAQEFASIKLGDRNSLDPKAARKIEEIGSWLLAGSPGSSQWSFAVGGSALGLLRENDPNHGLYTNMSDWVNMWTDGAGAKKFKEMVGEKEE